MWRTIIVLFFTMALSGCYVVLNVPPSITYWPIYRDTYVNKGMEWAVCEGRVIIVNESRMRIRVMRNDYSAHADKVRRGVPYEHIVVVGYDQYGREEGWIEKTFLCAGDKEYWVIKDWMLWWHFPQ